MTSKSQVLKALIETVEAELKTSLGASRDAADYATNEEAKADSKYDTQGLEASYLAAGQASMARELMENLATLRSLEDELTASCSTVKRGALVQCSFGDFDEWFYLCPVGGGETLDLEEEVSVLSGKSPLGAAILGKSAGDAFRLANGGVGRILEVR